MGRRAHLDGLLRWARRIRCARLEPPFERVGAQLALFVDDLITQFEAFPVDALRTVENALVASADGTQVVQMTLVFRLSNLEGYRRELESARRRLRS